MVIKKDGRREKFERQKILQGLLKASEKRPVPVEQARKRSSTNPRHSSAKPPDRERTTTEIGGLLMNQLKKLDKVAYVRFASVYLDFKDVKEFMDELKGLLKDRSQKIAPRHSTLARRLPAAKFSPREIPDVFVELDGAAVDRSHRQRKSDSVVFAFAALEPRTLHQLPPDSVSLISRASRRPGLCVPPF